MSSAMMTTKLGRLGAAAAGVGAAEWPHPARQASSDTAAQPRLAPPGRMER